MNIVKCAMRFSRWDLTTEKEATTGIPSDIWRFAYTIDAAFEDDAKVIKLSDRVFLVYQNTKNPLRNSMPDFYEITDEAWEQLAGLTSLNVHVILSNGDWLWVIERVD